MWNNSKPTYRLNKEWRESKTIPAVKHYILWIYKSKNLKTKFNAIILYKHNLIIILIKRKKSLNILFWSHNICNAACRIGNIATWNNIPEGQDRNIKKTDYTIIVRILITLFLFDSFMCKFKMLLISKEKYRTVSYQLNLKDIRCGVGLGRDI